jgi:nicotinate dehydrogenase large molybdopterin subunit
MASPESPRVLRPESAHEAVQLLSEHGESVRLVAGGTAIQLEWARGEPQPDLLIDIARLKSLSGVFREEGPIRIGAMMRLSELEADPLIVSCLPLLAWAIKSVAAPAVRRLATIGGNVATGTGCLIPTLLALDAAVEWLEGGSDHVQPLEAWLDHPHPRGGMLTAILVSAPKAQWRSIYRKIGLRAAFTPSVIGAAGLISLDGDRIVDARFAVGGGITRPQRLRSVEIAITGRLQSSLEWKTLRDDLAGAIDAPSDAFRSARYRRIAAANALSRGLLGPSPNGRARGKLRPAPGTQPDEIELSRGAVGQRWLIRPDIAGKVHGTLKYLTDHREPGMLVGRILRAGIPHACIRAIDTSAAEALPGVVAVVTHRDVPGLNAFGILIQDQPAFCFDKVRYGGDPVAAIAAIDERTAAEALSLIRVKYEPLPIVDDPLTTLEPGSPHVHDGGNLRTELRLSRGDTSHAFRVAAHIVDDVYVTPRQMHVFMETEGGYCIPKPDGTLKMCAGGQYGTRDRLQLSRILARPEASIRLITSPTGGAFGGKDELTVQPALALLALKSGRPVRLHLDRAESIIAGWKRNPMRIRMRTACDADGYLVAQEVDVLADCGAYASLGPAVLETALEHACGPYAVPNVKTHGRLVYTNNGVCGAFRGFGANQMAFAVECQLGRLAELVGLDPVEIRRRNVRKPGAPGYLGQRHGPTERLVEMLDAAAADPIWQESTGHDEITGVGMALNYQGNGLGTLPDDRGGVRLALLPDGLIEAAYGLDEMGQGALSAIKHSVSAALGVGWDDVVPLAGDTGLTPDSGSTTASRGTYVIWKGAQLAAPAFRAALLAAAASFLRRDHSDLELAPGGIRDGRSNSGTLLVTFGELASAITTEDRPAARAEFDFPKTDYTGGNARFLFCYGATLARVAIDPVSGMVRVLELRQHTAAGGVVDPAAYLGQIEGGGIQGLGFTLTEDSIMSKGASVTANLDSYMVPTIQDAPERVAVYAEESLDPGDPYGPRGIGELGIGAVTPAIAAAIAEATGYWPSAAPIAPESLLDAMARKS